MPWAMQSQEGSMQLQQFSESRAPFVCCDPAAKAKQPAGSWDVWTEHHLRKTVLRFYYEYTW